MTYFLVAFAAFCIGNYLGRKDGLADREFCCERCFDKGATCPCYGGEESGN